jgi:glycopeptide antibiotics resistance protein
MKDLVKHFIAGVAFSLVVFLVFWLMTGRISDVAIIVAGAGSLLLGAAKEIIWDLWLKKGTPEVDDITFTWSGGLIAVFALKIIELF